MKKNIITLALAVIVATGTSAFIIKNSTGITGYAGSPGEGTCNSCHGGGVSAVSGITVSSVPAFSTNANSDLEYMPDSTYEISVEVSAAGFSRYGFASQILNPSHTNAGTLQNAGAGVKFLNVGSKRSAVHTTPKITSTGSAIFTYKWLAPSSGDATIYAISNAVNGNGLTSGDFVIAPVSMALVAAPPPPPDTTNLVGIKTTAAIISRVSVFPNPASDLATLSYYLHKVGSTNIEIVDIKGARIKLLYSQQESPGMHSTLLDLRGIDPGVYFIKTSFDQQKASQKLITIQ